jgi:ribosome biogenesis protein UTP30
MSTAVDVELADRAVKALLKHEKLRANEKALLGDDKAIQVQFTLEKIPQNASHKPIRVLIPHALYKIDADDNNGLEEPSVCLIVKEESKPWVQEMISNFPKEMGFVKKVLGLQSLRKKHARYEQRRVLLSRYDVFMADDRILPMLAKSLGKEFFKAKKQPIPIALTRKQALPFVILQSLQATFLFISSGTTLTVRAATTAMSQKDVLENVQAVVENAIPKIPGKWSNIRCISIKTPSSMSLPFYNKTPEELAVISKLAGIEANDVEDLQVDQKEKKNAKRKLAAKSPLVQALKKQKKLEAETIEERTAESAKKSDKKEKKKKRVVEAEIEETVVVEKKQKKKRTVSAEVKVEETVVLEKKQTKKRSGSAETEVKETAAVEGSPTKKQKADFIASKKFKGSKKGYVFHRGKRGIGYYVDIKPVVDKMAMEALKRQATQQSRGEGRSGSRKKGRKGRR